MEARQALLQTSPELGETTYIIARTRDELDNSQYKTVGVYTNWQRDYKQSYAYKYSSCDSLSEKTPDFTPPNANEPDLAWNNLPVELWMKIAKDYLNGRESWNLARTCRQLFFGGSNRLDSSLLVEHARQTYLAELKMQINAVKFSVGGGLAVCMSSDAVYAWGSNRYGQIRRRLPVNFLKQDETISQVIVGATLLWQENHMFMVTNQGRCFGWGSNEFGQLGLGYEQYINVPIELPLFSLAKDEGISQLVTGLFHSLMLTSKGRCFVWGANEVGQLGLGDYRNRNFPTELPLNFLNPDEKISQVTAYYNYTLMVTTEGRCFVWGLNDNYQLGLGNNFNINTPTELPLTFLRLDENERIKQIVGGNDHILMLTSHGRCFVWGRNVYGVLGMPGDNGHRRVPTELPLTFLHAGESISQLVAGGYHSLMVTSEGRYFVCGVNDQGQLGLGDYHCRHVPIELPLTFLATNEEINQVLTGTACTQIVTSKGRYFAWGWDFLGMFSSRANRYNQTLGRYNQPLGKNVPTEYKYPGSELLQKRIANANHLQKLITNAKQLGNASDSAGESNSEPSQKLTTLKCSIQ